MINPFRITGASRISIFPRSNSVREWRQVEQGKAGGLIAVKTSRAFGDYFLSADAVAITFISVWLVVVRVAFPHCSREKTFPGLLVGRSAGEISDRITKSEILAVIPPRFREGHTRSPPSRL